jgi:pilus assembly protein Flp/PilA
MLARFRTFANDERGATAIEYALICAFMAVFIIGSLSLLGTKISSEFSEVSAAMK